VTYTHEYLTEAHKASFANKAAVLVSKICGCFYCRSIYSPDKITEFIDEEQPKDETAICPMCGIDSVIGSSSGYPVNDSEFLKAMHKYWF